MLGRAPCVWAAFAVVLAGCVGDSGTASADDERSFLSEDELADAQLGSIDGIVVDQELSPVPFADIGLQATPYVDRTGADGRFRVDGIEPGEYVLLAARLGYEPMAQRVLVTAGQVQSVQVALSQVSLGEVAYYEVLPHTGFLECAMGAVVFVAPCSYGYRLAHGAAHQNGVNLSNYGAPPDIQDNRFWLNFTIGPGVEELVAELVWEPASAAASQMQLFILCGDFDPVLNECTQGHRYGAVQGPSPVTVRSDADQLTKACPGPKFCPEAGPAWFANDVAMPFNNPQVAFQQKFDVWDSIFYHGESPDGYTALPDL